jgi:hypothetical protein
MDDAEKLRAEFLLVEYKESANAYFKGVDIGYTGLKGYITINALFVAVIAAVAESKFGPRAYPGHVHPPNAVIAGLVPAIHALLRGKERRGWP